MKTSTRQILASVILLTVASFAVNAQTNVSGGIYANTTWTLANSPYIVVDTVVVFPGVTLTIEPGVTVKFADGKYLEIRQGTLIAAGTAADSINFTSNSGSPHSGIWNGIVFTNTIGIHINYCIFKYANISVNGRVSTIQNSYFYMNNNCINDNVDTLRSSFFYLNTQCISGHVSLIKNTTFFKNTNCLGTSSASGSSSNLDSCIFENNSYGVNFGGNNITNCKFLGNSGIALDLQWADDSQIKNCIFCNNAYACRYISYLSTCTIMNCNFSQNHIGLTAGIHLSGGSMTVSGNIFTDNDTAISAGGTCTGNYIYHNKVGAWGAFSSSSSNNYICNNSLYNLIWTGTANINFPNVCWCDTDSATIRSKIYDGYVNIAYGLVNFSPVIICDSSAFDTIPPINCSAVVNTGVEEITHHSITGAFEIYPNPAFEHLTLELQANSSKSEIKIFNMLGGLVYSSRLTGQKTTIDISTLTKGMYIIQVATADEISRQKLIKE